VAAAAQAKGRLRSKFQQQQQVHLRQRGLLPRSRTQPPRAVV